MTATRPDTDKPSARALMEILRDELALHLDMFNKKRQERPCLATGAVTELQSLTKDIEDLSEKIREVEARRMEEMTRWSKLLGCSPSNITIRMIAGHLPAKESEKLLEIGDQLKAMVIALRHENNVNGLLLQRSLRLVNEELRILLQGEEDSAAYTSQGASGNPSGPVGRRLVDCRA